MTVEHALRKPSWARTLACCVVGALLSAWAASAVVGEEPAAPSARLQRDTVEEAAGPITGESDTGPGGNGSQDYPPPLTHYKGREIATTMHYTGAGWLVRAEREREENSSKLLRILGVKRGQSVCDLGCGNGFHSLSLARMVGPRGRVLAVDIQREMLLLLEKRAEQAGLENIETILGSPVDPRLPAESLDMVLLVDVYHEFSHPEHMLQAIRRSLKPDGKMVLVEFRGEDPDVPILPLHKMTKEQIRREIIPNGFRLVRQYDKLPWQHVMFFEPVAQSASKN